MAWYDQNLEKENIYESVTLSNSKIQDLSKKLGFEVEKTEDGDLVVTPNGMTLMDKNVNMNFLDTWLGNDHSKLEVEKNREHRNSTYELIDRILGEGILTLDTYADEALGMGFIEQPIDIEFSDKEVGKKILEILRRNNFIKNSRSNIRDLCKWGDFGIEIIPKEGSNDPMDLKLNILTPNKWEAKFIESGNSAIGYEIKDPYKSKLRDQDKIYQPWEFVQFTVPDNEFAPYGRSVLEAMRIPFDQLVTIEALLALSRASRVERLVIKVPTSETNAVSAMNKLNMIKSAWKNVIFSNNTSSRKSYARTPSLQDTLFIPSDEGFSIDTLKNSIDISSTADVEYFQNKVLMMTGLPKGLFLADESTDRYHALAQQDLKFARKLIPFQDGYATGITKLCMVLAAYLDADLKTLKIKTSIKRPIQMSDQLLSNYEAISRTASEFVDSYKRINADEEGKTPELPRDTYPKLLAQFGIPQEILKIFAEDYNNKSGNYPKNSPDDDNISVIKSSFSTLPIISSNSEDVYSSNIILFESLQSRNNKKSIMESLNGKPTRSSFRKNSKSRRKSERIQKGWK